MDFGCFLSQTMQQLALAVPFQKSRSLLGFCRLHVALFHVGLGQRKGCILQSVRGIAVALRLVFPLHALRSMATRIARRLQQRQRHLARDDAIDETHAVQGPRSARQTSFETAATHHSRFASRRFRALQPPSAEFCCEEMPRLWDSIGTPRCCRDLRNRLKHFA